jgi:hypothetical protein
MAIEKVKKHMILSLLIFNIAFWLSTANPKKKKGWVEAGRRWEATVIMRRKRKAMHLLQP